MCLPSVVWVLLWLCWRLEYCVYGLFEYRLVRLLSVTSRLWLSVWLMNWSMLRRVHRTVTLSRRRTRLSVWQRLTDKKYYEYDTVSMVDGLRVFVLTENRWVWMASVVLYWGKSQYRFERNEISSLRVLKEEVSVEYESVCWWSRNWQESNWNVLNYSSRVKYYELKQT